MPETPEQKTRHEIDAKLIASGWTVQDRDDFDLTDGRWRCYTLEEIQKRDKLSLDLFWIKDQALTDTDALPPPDVIAAEIVEELESAFELFSNIAKKLPKSTN